MDEYRGHWTLGQKIACLVLFAAVMLALRFVLHAVVPPASQWADDTIGPTPHAIIVLVVFCTAAAFVYPPLVRGWLAKRRLDADK